MQQERASTKFVTKEKQHETTWMLPFTELRAALHSAQKHLRDPMIESLLFLLREANVSQRTGVLQVVVTCNQPESVTFTLSLTVLAGQLITIREGSRHSLEALRLLRKADSVRSHRWLDLPEDEDPVTFAAPDAPPTLARAHAPSRALNELCVST